MNLNGILHKFAARPKPVFLLDGMGAALSAVLLGLVLPNFSDVLGVPTKTLYTLAILPIFIGMYDMYCFMMAQGKWKKRLRRIIRLNLLYCLTSIIFIGLEYESITKWGIIYFAGEIFIILLLVRFERSVWKRVD